MSPTLILLIALTLFAIDNKSFFDKTEKLKSQGYTWQYTGKEWWEDKGNNLAILIESPHGGKPRTYWKIGE